MRHIGEDQQCTIQFGGLQGFAGPSWVGGPVSVRATGTSLGLEEKLDTVKFAAFGDTNYSYRGTKGEIQGDLEFYIPAGGRLKTVAGLTTLLGQYCRVIIQPDPTLTAGAETYIGIITNNKFDSKPGAEQKETITLMVPAE